MLSSLQNISDEVSMKLGLNSYVVVEIPNKKDDPPDKKLKKVYGKVIDLKPKTLTVAAVKNGKRFEKVPTENVLALLGRIPAPGRVYGQKTEFPQNVRTIEGQQVVFYHHLDAGDEKELEDTLKKMKPLFQRLKLQVEFAIRPKSGGKVYSYKSKKVKKETVGVISLYPNAFSDPIMSLEECIAHEMFVCTWFQKLERKQKVRWIEVWRNYVNLTNMDVGKVEKVSQAFMKSGKSTKEFLEGLKEEHEIDLFKRLVVWIKQVHQLSKNNVDALSQEGKLTKDLFPDQKVVLGWVDEVFPGIDRDPSELFVQIALSDYLKETVPPDMAKLLKWTRV
jgi:hypothetical protein